MPRSLIKLAPLAALSALLSVSTAFADDSSRRRPGQDDPNSLATDTRAIPPARLDIQPESIPVPDRWRILESLGLTDNILDPYSQNTLKGDKPIFDEWFMSFNAVSDTTFEPHSIPVPTGIATTDQAGTNDLFGRVDQRVLVQTLVLNLTVFKGFTAFKPPEIEFRATPVLQYNDVSVGELGILFADPRKGKTRTDSHVGMQELFLDYHIRNVSDRYDFDSIRVGIQPINADFRGFLFQDDQLGIRLFGNRDNNKWQYNLAYFRRLEKDTNSGLNTFDQPVRNDEVFLANLYHQDFPVTGLTTQATVIYNKNNEFDEAYYDRNGFLVRPAALANSRPRKYDVIYPGMSVDGHIGWLNLTATAYGAIGHNENNPFSGQKNDIRSFFFAAEPSVDFSWMRLRGSLLYASGDSDPYDRTETGFDSILENPIFAGADTSYWIRQAIPFIGGGGVALVGRNGVLPSLRSSKDEGQSNFTNPGLFLAGLGADFDVLPELRLSFNVNRLQFANTASLEALRQQAGIPKDIGTDLSAAVTWRPWFIQNVVFRVSGAMLFAEKGFRSLYDDGGRTKSYYSILTNAVLSY